jgi:hypothetical protein
VKRATPASCLELSGPIGGCQFALTVPKENCLANNAQFRRTNHFILALYMMSVVMAKKLKVTTMLVYDQDGGRGTMLLSQLQ